MEVLTFPGGYQDQAGYEAICWRVEGSRGYKLPSPEFFTSIRGIDMRGTDFDSMEPVDPSAAAGQLPLNQVGELSECLLSGDLPCTMATGGHRRPATITFPWTASSDPAPHRLRLARALTGLGSRSNFQTVLTSPGIMPRTGRALRVRRETSAMPTCSVGSLEPCQPRTQADREACYGEQPESSHGRANIRRYAWRTAPVAWRSVGRRSG